MDYLLIVYAQRRHALLDLPTASRCRAGRPIPCREYPGARAGRMVRSAAHRFGDSSGATRMRSIPGGAR